MSCHACHATPANFVRGAQRVCSAPCALACGPGGSVDGFEYPKHRNPVLPRTSGTARAGFGDLPLELASYIMGGLAPFEDRHAARLTAPMMLTPARAADEVDSSLQEVTLQRLLATPNDDALIADVSTALASRRVPLHLRVPITRTSDVDVLLLVLSRIANAEADARLEADRWDAEERRREARGMQPSGTPEPLRPVGVVRALTMDWATPRAVQPRQAASMAPCIGTGILSATTSRLRLSSYHIPATDARDYLAGANPGDVLERHPALRAFHVVFSFGTGCVVDLRLLRPILPSLHDLALVACGLLDGGDALRTATSLVRLDLSKSNVVSLTPLTRLTTLTKLSISETYVADLAPLANLPRLTELYAANTYVATLQPLAGLTSLTALDVRRTRVDSLASLSALTSLSTLSVAETRVASFEPIAALTRLTTLVASASPVASLRPLARMSRLENLHVPFTRIADVGVTARMPRLEYLDISGSQVASLEPLCVPTPHPTLEHLEAHRLPDGVDYGCLGILPRLAVVVVARPGVIPPALEEAWRGRTGEDGAPAPLVVRYQ